MYLCLGCSLLMRSTSGIIAFAILGGSCVSDVCASHAGAGMSGKNDEKYTKYKLLYKEFRDKVIPSSPNK